MKTSSTTWASIVLTAILGLALTCCAKKEITIPEVEYASKIVGCWQGTVSSQQETMSLADNGTFVCKLVPTGFISTMIFPRPPGRVSGTWSVSGTIVNLRITDERNENLASQLASSTIVAFTGDKLVLKPSNGEVSSFQRIGIP